MLAILNKTLNELPFNGKKTAIGIVSSLLLYFLPDFPIAELDSLLNYGSYLLTAVGVLHKYIKAKI